MSRKMTLRTSLYAGTFHYSFSPILKNELVKSMFWLLFIRAIDTEISIKNLNMCFIFIKDTGFEGRNNQQETFLNKTIMLKNVYRYKLGPTKTSFACFLRT